MILRDYNYLDFSMVNLSKDVRRYIHSNFMSIDNQLKEFVRAKYNTDESTFMSNLNLYNDVISDKKSFLKTLIKAR
jgi:hypothetical protein